MIRYTHLVNAVKANGQKNLNKYGQTVEDTKGVLNVFMSWQIYHTKSKANYAAHGLAKAARNQTSHR